MLPDKINTILLNEIVPSPYQTRREFFEQDMMDSLTKNNQIEPIQVRRVNGNFELIGGERRVRAARKLEWIDLKAFVIECTNDEAENLVLISNLERKDLTPVELIEALGLRVDNLLKASEIGKEYSAISDKAEKRLTILLGEMCSEKTFKPIKDRNRSSQNRKLITSENNFNKFIKVILSAFEQLPIKTGWEGFYKNDWLPFTKQPEYIRDYAIKNKVAKSVALNLGRLHKYNPEKTKELIEEPKKINVKQIKKLITEEKVHKAAKAKTKPQKIKEPYTKDEAKEIRNISKTLNNIANRLNIERQKLDESPILGKGKSRFKTVMTEMRKSPKENDKKIIEGVIDDIKQISTEYGWINEYIDKLTEPFT